MVGGVAIAAYPFGIPLMFLALLARHSDDLYLDEDMEARKAAVEKQLEDSALTGLDSSVSNGGEDSSIDHEECTTLQESLQHDQDKAQQRRVALMAELQQLDQTVSRHQHAVRVYGFIFAQYRVHAWYWEAGLMLAMLQLHIVDSSFVLQWTWCIRCS